MLGQAVGGQALQLGEREAFGIDLVDQPRQLPRQLDGLSRADGGGFVVRALALRPVEHQTGQQELAAQGRHGRWNAELLRRREARLLAQGQLLVVDIAEGADLRQDEWLAVTGAQEGLPQAAAGPPGRQQHQ